MKLDRRSILAGATATFAAPFLAATPSRADAKRQSLIDQCLETGRKVLSGKNYPDVLKLMPKARAVLIIPELVQGGFIIGAAGGRGTLLTKTGPGNWSYPGFYGMGSGSLGFQIGGKVSEIVFIVLTEKGLSALLSSKFKFGAEAGVTMVAVGAGAFGAALPPPVPGPARGPWRRHRRTDAATIPAAGGHPASEQTRGGTGRPRWVRRGASAPSRRRSRCAR